MIKGWLVEINISFLDFNWYFPKDAHQKSEGVSEVRFKKNRLFHLGNVEKPPHTQFFAQRAP